MYVLEFLDSQHDALEGEAFAQMVLNTSGGGAEQNDPTK
jgi:hypothetical protein